MTIVYHTQDGRILAVLATADPAWEQKQLRAGLEVSSFTDASLTTEEKKRNAVNRGRVVKDAKGKASVEVAG